MRLFTSLGLLLALAIQVSAAQAELLKVHDFEAGQGGLKVGIELTMSEMYAVRFEASSYPVKLKEIQFYMGDNPQAPGTECGLFHLWIWEDGGGGAQPGKLLFDTESLDAPFEVAATSALQAFVFGPGQESPTIDGPFRVGLEAEEKTCVLQFGNGKFPVLYVDDQITNGANLLYGSPTPGTLEWLWLEDVTLNSGDFVVQVITVGGQVQPGTCQGPGDCDDGDPCTQDVCGTDKKCSHPPASGDCSDGDPCTVGDACTGGVCKAGAPTDCDDKDPCTTDICDAATGACKHQAIAGCGGDADAGPDTGGPGDDPDAAGADTGAPGGDAGSGTLWLEQLTPTSAATDVDTIVTVIGGGFTEGLQARLGPNQLIGVTVKSDGALTAIVPRGITPGVYDLIVQAKGDSATLASAFEVRPASRSSGGDGGCAHGPSSSAGAGAALALGLAVALLRLRRRDSAER